MKITYSKMDYNDEELFKLISSWHNSTEVRKNYLLNFCEEDTTKEIKWRDIQERFSNDELERFIVFCDDVPVGEFNYHLKHPLQLIENSFWLGISIGETEFKGRGVASYVMAELEKIAKSLEKKTMEIGVYEFNERGLGFYNKLGYEEFHRDKDFAYWGDKKWSFIRMKKNI